MGRGDITSSSLCKKCRIIDTGEDRISNLPESVLSHILSRMPTKDAVITSALSKNWEYKWTSIYKIDLEDSSHTKEKVGIFVRFVDRVLNFTCNSQIKSFSLSFKKIYDDDRLATWISALLWRKVQTLEISKLKWRYGESFVLPLPHRLFSTTSLTELKINVSCTLRVAGYNYFPNIKCLKFLKQVHIVNEQSLETGELLLYFPVLKEFETHDCQWSNVKSVKIDAPEMIIFRHGRRAYNITNDRMLVILANKLEQFKIYASMDNIVLRAPLVHYMYLGVHEGGEIIGSRAFGVLNGLPGLKHLRTSGYLVKILEAVIRSKTGDLPFFGMLQHLDVYSGMTGTALRELLGVLPSLKTLILSISSAHIFNGDCDCEVAESLPSCVLSNLKEIRIREFEGFNCQTHLVKFLLENAENLEKLYVHVPENKPFVRMTEVKRIVPAIPRRSSCVSVEVIDAVKKKKIMAASSEEGQVISIHSEEEFKAQVQKGQEQDELVVVDFTDSWCGPCRFIAPILAEIAKKTTHVIFLKVDVDELKPIGV